MCFQSSVSPFRIRCALFQKGVLDKLNKKKCKIKETVKNPPVALIQTPTIILKLTLHFSRRRDIAKNSLLRWPVFLYWTCLGVFDAVIFFFGAYFLFDNTTFTSNGQVSLQADGSGGVKPAGLSVLARFLPGVFIAIVIVVVVGRSKVRFLPRPPTPTTVGPQHGISIHIDNAIASFLCTVDLYHVDCFSIAFGPVF